MAEIKIVGVDEPSPNAVGEYVQLITRFDQPDQPGRIVSDIEHFSLKSDGQLDSISRETRAIGFREAIVAAEAYASERNVPIVYATDRTSADLA